jgi:hypothetical protein
MGTQLQSDLRNLTLQMVICGRRGRQAHIYRASEVVRYRGAAHFALDELIISTVWNGSTAWAMDILRAMRCPNVNQVSSLSAQSPPPSLQGLINAQLKH